MCLFVCLQNNLKNYRQILMKFQNMLIMVAQGTDNSILFVNLINVCIKEFFNGFFIIALIRNTGGVGP